MKRLAAGGVKRLAGLGFAALVLATLGAFFITQHLKVSDPLIAGVSIKPTWINPVSGRTCTLGKQQVSFRSAEISFYLPDHHDHVAVQIVNANGRVVRTFRWHYLRQGQRTNVLWDGRESGGSFAPDGAYYVRIMLRTEARSFEISSTPIEIATHAPVVKLYPITVAGVGGTQTTGTANNARAKSSSPAVIAAQRTAGATVVTPGRTVARISFASRPTHAGRVLIYRVTAAGSLRLVGSYGLGHNQHVAHWNGKIDGSPAPAGAYLIGIQIADYACNPGQFPTRTTSPLGSTAGAGVTVSYLSVSTPLTPIATGATAAARVNSGGAAYSWTLHKAGSATPIAHGSVVAAVTGTGSGSATLRVKAPGSAGLYVLSVVSGTHTATAPLLVSGAAKSVLVVVPALSWQGLNPVDQTGDGIPDTLTRAGNHWIGLERPLVNGLPAGWSDTAALLRYLTAHGDQFQLTSDIALAEGVGPRLAGHSGVLLAGSFSWLPTSLAHSLRSYVHGGGRVVAIGTRSLMATARFKSTAAGYLTGDPVATSTDPFGLGRGPLATAEAHTFPVLSDELSLFSALSEGSGTDGTELSGLTDTQQLVLPSTVSEASLIGSSLSAPVGAAITVGSGEVAELAVSGFGHSLSTSAGSRNLLGGFWQLLGG